MPTVSTSSSSTLQPIEPYVSDALKHFPVQSFEVGNALIWPIWSGEGNLSYMVANPESREVFLIDPDLEILGTYLQTLDFAQLTLVAVIDTHNHAEHATAAPTLKALFDVPYIMNHLSPSSYVTDRIEHDDTLALADIPVTFYHTPGHTVEMTTLAIDSHYFTGDSVFNTSSGRADLPGGSAEMQFDTLQWFKSLPDDIIIHPGHDYDNRLFSTMGAVKAANPRLQFDDKATFVKAMEEEYADNPKPDNLLYFVAYNAR